jgi:hypothetical protein
VEPEHQTAFRRLVDAIATTRRSMMGWVAFAMSPWTEGDGTTDRVVKIKRAEHGSWARELVRIDLPNAGESKDGMLEFAGLDRFPVMRDGDQSTDELIELLGR